MGAPYLVCRMLRDEVAVAEVEGEDVIIPGFEVYAFFVHPTLETAAKDDSWTVTERSTGFAVAKEVWGKENAVVAAQVKLEGMRERGKTLEELMEVAFAQLPLTVRERLGQND